MPTPLPTAVQSAVRAGLGKYSGTLGEDFTAQALDRLLIGIKSILNPTQESRITDGESRTVTVGETPATVRGGITDLLKRFENPEAIAEELNLDFKIQTATDVAHGAGRYVADNFDQAEVDEYPALELLRVYDRDVPRGFQRGPKGALIPVPGDDWESRWAAAGGTLYDGRMIALKDSDVWQALGDGVGGYDDTLGNPYPPFAFNSGYDVDAVSRAECLDLGVITEGQPIAAAKIDFNNLFGLAA